MNDETYARASLTENALPEECQRDLQGCLPGTRVQTENIELRKRANGSDALLDAEWTQQDEHGFSTIRRTLAFFHRPGAELPPITIQPKKGVVSKFLVKLMSHAGVPEVAFPARPDIAEAYAVQSFTPDSTRALLEPAVLDALSTVDGLCIKIESNAVIAWVHRSTVDFSAGGGSRDRDERLDDASRDQLLRDAWQVCRFIVEDAQAGRRAARAVEGSYAQESARTARRHGGMVGRMLDRLLVTSEMADRVYNQSPPRSGIDGPVVRRAYGGSTFPLLVLGGLTLGFITLGTLFSTLGGEGPGAKIAPLFFIPPVVTGSIAFFILRWRLGRRRLLLRGRLVEAQVHSVSATGLTSGNDSISKISFKLTGGTSGMPSMNVRSAAACVAERLRDQESVTQVLVDENDERPRKCLWIGGWVLAAQRD